MCLPIQDRSKRDRVLISLAGFALAAGIGLPYFVHPTGAWNKDWLEALRGLLIGVSIGMNLLVIIRKRRNRRAV